MADDPENPSLAQLPALREQLSGQVTALNALNSKITQEEAELEALILQRHLALSALQHEKERLEDEVQETRAALAPVRRLPDDLLREVVWWIFEGEGKGDKEKGGDPACGWMLSAVCRRWRRVVLGMPRLWSKVRTAIAPIVLSISIPSSVAYLAIVETNCCLCCWSKIVFHLRPFCAHLAPI